MATCRSCPAEGLVWAVHERTGKRTLLQTDDAGSFVLLAPDALLPTSASQDPVYKHVGASTAPEQRYSNHFARCPGAEHHRRR